MKAVPGVQLSDESCLQMQVVHDRKRILWICCI